MAGLRRGWCFRITPGGVVARPPCVSPYPPARSPCRTRCSWRAPLRRDHRGPVTLVPAGSGRSSCRCQEPGRPRGLRAPALHFRAGPFAPADRRARQGRAAHRRPDRRAGRQPLDARGGPGPRRIRPNRAFGRQARGPPDGWRPRVGGGRVRRPDRGQGRGRTGRPGPGAFPGGDRRALVPGRLRHLPGARRLGLPATEARRPVGRGPAGQPPARPEGAGRDRAGRPTRGGSPDALGPAGAAQAGGP